MQAMDLFSFLDQIPDDYEPKEVILVFRMCLSG